MSAIQEESANMAKTFMPFENEAQVVQIGGADGITVENRIDHISLYGSLDLTRDAQGLHLARALLDILSRTVSALEADPELPEKIDLPAAPGKTDNPFSV